MKQTFAIIVPVALAGCSGSTTPAPAPTETVANGVADNAMERAAGPASTGGAVFHCADGTQFETRSNGLGAISIFQNDKQILVLNQQKAINGDTVGHTAYRVEGSALTVTRGTHSQTCFAQPIPIG